MVGASKAMELGHGLVVTAIMGMITATAGGLIRDIVCGHPAMLLREDIYATAALVGGVVFWGTIHFGLDPSLALMSRAFTVFVIRALAIRFDIDLPKPRL